METKQPPDQFGTKSPDSLTLKGKIKPPKEKVTNQEVLRYVAERWIYFSILGLILTPLIVLGIIYRYTIIGTVWQQKYYVAVYDNKTDEPVIGANVSIDGHTTKTNEQGLADIKMPVGHQVVRLSHANYTSSVTPVLVPIKVHVYANFFLNPTGKEVSVRVTNELTKLPVESALISAGGMEAETNSNGNTTIDLAKSTKVINGSITTIGFNTAKVPIAFNEANNGVQQFTILPAGEVLYLSQDSGVINVDKVNLDGSSKQVAFAGTSAMTQADTQLMLSDDSQYGALLTTKNTTNPALYVITASNDKVAELGNGNGASYFIVGWTPNNRLIFIEYFTGVHPWAYDNTQMMSYNPVTDVVTKLDVNDGVGVDAVSYGTESYVNVQILSDNQIFYVKTWTGNSPTAISKQGDTINVIGDDGQNKTILATVNPLQYSPTPYVGLISPNEAGITMVSTSGKSDQNLNYFYLNNQFFTTSDGDIISTILNPPYNSNFYYSTGGLQIAWTRAVGAGNAFYVAPNGYNAGQQVALLDPSYSLYGWYGANYLLVLQNNVTLYIMPEGGVNNINQMTKLATTLPPNVPPIIGPSLVS